MKNVGPLVKNYNKYHLCKDTEALISEAGRDKHDFSKSVQKEDRDMNVKNKLSCEIYEKLLRNGITCQLKRKEKMVSKFHYFSCTAFVIIACYNIKVFNYSYKSTSVS
jgi:hypothetical protein